MRRIGYNKVIVKVVLLFVSLVFLCGFGPAQGHHVVIEVNVPGTNAYGLVLNNIENLKKAMAPDPVDVEVVCHGSGIDMLRTGNGLGKRMEVLARKGVVFAACANTIRGKHIDRKKLYSFIRVVPSGVAEVVKKQEAGWSYLKGAY
ncbi:MAG TPA: DsrE family protein [Fimbriimonadaceae bacterium]|nr:DsrE family protein [Fimbriimonadaceae bacterium]